MVEAVLPSRHCLWDDLRSPVLARDPRRKHHGDNLIGNLILNPNRSLQKIGRFNRSSRKMDGRSERKHDFMVVKEQKQDLLMEQVRILKRGEVIRPPPVKGKMEAKEDVYIDEVPRTPVATKLLSKQAAAKEDIAEVMVSVDPSKKTRSSKGAKEDVETEPWLLVGEDEISRTPVAAKMLPKQVTVKMRRKKGVKEVSIDEMCKRLDFVELIVPEQEVFSKMMETHPKLFAGSMFMSSPCPSSLPKPSFSFRKKDGSFDLATNTLLCLLNLEVC